MVDYKNMDESELLEVLDIIQERCVRIVHGKSAFRLSQIMSLAYLTIRAYQTEKTTDPKISILREILTWKKNGSLYLENSRTWTVEKDNVRKRAEVNSFSTPAYHLIPGENPNEDSRIVMMSEYFNERVVLVRLKNERPRYRTWKKAHHTIERLVRFINDRENLAMSPRRMFMIFDVSKKEGGEESWKRFCEDSGFYAPPSVVMPGRFQIYVKGLSKHVRQTKNYRYPGVTLLNGSHFYPIAGSFVENGMCMWGPEKVPGVFPVVYMSGDAFMTWKKI